MPGTPRVLMPLPGFPGYADRWEHVAANDEGFDLRAAP